MIRIFIPPNNIPEREYILDIVFNQFLKVPYKMIVSPNEITESYIFLSESTRYIIIKDAFFSCYPDPLSYLKDDAIPKNVTYSTSSIYIEKNIPILFGIDKIEIEEEFVISHIDIFATIFFMLTRWEEYVISHRDRHDRFQAIDSLAFRFGFLDRPIVNEYIEFLWNMLIVLGYDERVRDNHKFSMMLTHDVDEVEAYPSFKKFSKQIAGDLLIRKKPLLAVERVCNYLKDERDPYDTFDEIMDISDRYNLKSHFFFMSGGTTRYDNRYSIESSVVKELIKKIKRRGHHIGFHPSYSAYRDFKQFSLEKDVLESASNLEIDSGREHYLRFEVPTTWQIWEDSGLSWCSNMAYADHSGFRTGVCYPFTPFNILTRVQLNLKEIPLIVMEVTLMEESDSVEMFEEKIVYYFNIVKKYGGEFVFLWHNSNFKIYEDFNREKINLYSSVYEKVINNYREIREC